MPIIPLLVEGHKLWAFVDSGATFSKFSIDDARRIGIDWDKGRRQMIVVGDGSYIPMIINFEGIEEKINLQRDDDKAKPFQFE